jgi:hypothetical protein
LILWTYTVLPFPILLSSYNLPLIINYHVFNLSLVLLGKRNKKTEGWSHREMNL